MVCRTREPRHGGEGDAMKNKCRLQNYLIALKDFSFMGITALIITLIFYFSLPSGKPASRQTGIGWASISFHFAIMGFLQYLFFRQRLLRLLQNEQI